MHRLERLFLLPLAVAVLAGLSTSRTALADQVVYFVNGKAITVKKVEKGDKLTILEIDGGGRIGVPTAQIDRIEDLQLSPPSQSVVAPPVAAAPTQGATVAPAANAAQPAAGMQPDSQATGQGLGGQPTQPNGALAGVVPLQIPGGPVREATAQPVTATPGAVGAYSRPTMQSGANRELVGRRDGAIGQPGVGLRRPATRTGAIRGRSMAGFQPPLAPSERRGHGKADTTVPQSTAPPPPPTPADETAVDPAPEPEASSGAPPPEAATTDEAEPPEPPPAEEAGDDSAGER